MRASGAIDLYALAMALLVGGRESRSIEMPDIELIFSGAEEPFEIKLQGQPEVRRVDGTVEIILPVFAAGFADSTALMQARLSVSEAQGLSDQLRTCLETGQDGQTQAPITDTHVQA
jgi:hypothetical protein